MLKRIFALLLVFCMTLSGMALHAFAQSDLSGSDNAAQSITPLNDEEGEEGDLDGDVSVDEIRFVTISLGSSMELSVPASLKNQPIYWDSADASIVSVSNGVITAHAVGEVFISGILENGDSLLYLVEVSGDVVRISGSDRIATAISAADQMKAVLGKSSFDAIIIANGDNFADALTGSFLANAKSAPILLYRAKGMEKNEEYIQKNLSANGIIYILGGKSAVPESVEVRLIDAGYNVQRLEGTTRFETNLKILEAAGVKNQEILICTGWEYADSLSASATGLPIVMVNTTTNKLTDGQITFFQQYAGNQFTIIGGEGAVSKELEADIEAIVGEVDRVSGSIREETSVAIANRYFGTPDCALIAFSRNFPDGLCGGPLAYAMKAPLLLVNAGKESAAAAYVDACAITKGLILGGSTALSETVVEKIFFQ